MRGRLVIAVGLVALAWPGGGRAADMDASLSASVEYDDNVARVGDKTKDDAIFRITPGVKVFEDEGRARWSLEYTAPWEKAVSVSAIDDLRHFLTGSGNYRLTDQTELFLREQFIYSEAIETVTSFEDPAGPPQISETREPTLRNRIVFGTQHRFSPRTVGNLAFTHRLFQTNIEDRADNQAFVGNTNLRYALSPRHEVGAGFAFTFQDFKESNTGSRASSRSIFANPFAVWSWTIDETTHFEITAGPTFVDTNQRAPRASFGIRPEVPFLQLSDSVIAVGDLNSCPLLGGSRVAQLGSICPGGIILLDANSADLNEQADYATITGSAPRTYAFEAGEGTGSSDKRFTFFGTAELSRQWTPSLSSSLSYTRQDSTASGVAASSVLDFVSFFTSWQIAERWSASVRGDFARRESTNPINETVVRVRDLGTPLLSAPGFTVPQCRLDVNSACDLTQRVTDVQLDSIRWSAAVRVEHRLTENLRLALRYTYNQQRSRSDSNVRVSDFVNNLVTFGVEYDFDRWHLW